MFIWICFLGFFSVYLHQSGEKWEIKKAKNKTTGMPYTYVNLTYPVKEALF